MLKDCGHPGLLVVLDEIETLQRVRGDVREKGLNALRQLLDEIDAGRFPGLFLVITGTPAFYDGQQGVQRLPPTRRAARHRFLHRPRFDSPRAVQLRLTGFDLAKLDELGRSVRDLYAGGTRHPERIAERADDAYIGELATALTGTLGGRVGIAPRLFLKKLVDVLDRVDEHADFDPRRLDRLHPGLVHHIVNTLGWRALRPLQNEAIVPLLDGSDAILLAPTAGGKTEAAAFPLLSRMAEEN
ncbi:hypothetical protein GCM10022420_057060 [Streptomyces iranensis]|uniref:DEAD/DEAH-box helicase domain-containing protein n=1 Tax=Streptomyces iranensis TaxID=576784 RepID=A0A061A2M1_9ACTN|nr:hypothetical protein [Streptomyces iranensis]CDR09564.1 predicted protein [Streptomyces iranensis]